MNDSSSHLYVAIFGVGMHSIKLQFPMSCIMVVIIDIANDVCCIFVSGRCGQTYVFAPNLMVSLSGIHRERERERERQRERDRDRDRDRETERQRQRERAIRGVN